MPRTKGEKLTEVSNALTKHDASLKHPEHGRPSRRLDQLTGDDVCDETAAVRNGLERLENEHACWPSLTCTRPDLR